MSNRITILHITADYPDPVNQNKTKAVYNLIQNNKEFNHVIISINRNAFTHKHFRSFKENVYVIQYCGFPYGIGLKMLLLLLSKSIKTLIINKQISFDIIHAHKLTIEGIVASYLSKSFCKPFVCTVRGHSDMRIMTYKPFYRVTYKRILRKTKKIFLVAPWPKEKIEKKCNMNIEDKSVLLPNIVRSNISKNRREIEFSNRFVTALRMKDYKVKNIESSIKAFDIVASKIPDIHFDIFGGGRISDMKNVLRMIDSCRHKRNIHLLGAIENHAFCSNLPRYIGLVRPSYPETFGMVYLEALLAGVPIIHSKNTGLDGYFRNGIFSIATDHRSLEDISRAMMDLYLNQVEYKKNLIISLENGKFDCFRAEVIVQNYSEHILESI